MDNKELIERVDADISAQKIFLNTSEKLHDHHKGLGTGMAVENDKHKLKLMEDCKEALQSQDTYNPETHIVVPKGVLELVRFLCATWSEIDEWAYTDKDPMQYPVIQGARNQMNLRRIGGQPLSKELIREGVEFMIGKAITSKGEYNE